MGTEAVLINSEDGGTFTAFVARPSGDGPWPGILVLPEIYNANHHIRAVAERFAEQGFLALTPDVFWRLAADTYLPYTEDGKTQARALNMQLDVDQLVQDLGQCIQWLRSNPSGNGRVGVTGFCLGGKLTYLCAARHEIQAAASYYGVKIDNYLEEASSVTCPTIMHFAENDSHVPSESVDAISKRMENKANVEIFVYPGTEHGFNRFGEAPHHPQAAAIAMERTLGLFNKSLRK